MTRFLRLATYPVLAYLFFRIGFPEGSGKIYHFVIPPLMVGGAVAVFFLIKVVDVSSRLAEWGIELAFALAMILFVGYTLPQSNGMPPLRQLINGEHPMQAAARAGVSKLGMDPNAQPARFIISLFPKN